MKAALLPLLGLPKVALFTRDGASPSEIAHFLLDRGLDDYDAWVCECLGTSKEALIPAALPDLVGKRFDNLNVLVLLRRTANGSSPPEVADGRFAHPPTGAVLLTHDDVRALVLRRFRGLPDGPVWDVGAGIGGVSIELARALRGREIVAVERSSVQLTYLRENRLTFGAYNVRVVAGEAPECLREEDEPPSGIFLGGSGGRHDAILDLVAERLAPGGVFVANFVGLENLTECLGRMRALGWAEDLTQVQFSHAEPLAGLTTFVPQRPVWVLHATRPR